MRAAALAAQDRSLVVCERRFGESVRLYRKVMDQVQTQPKLVAEQCHTMVNTYVSELLDKGEASIRLLSEAAGDKSSMHPVNVTIVSLLLGKAMGLPMTQLVAKEVDMRGTFRFHAEFATAVRFLNEGLVNGKPVITGVMPVDRAIEAFDLAADKSQSLKVQISFSDAVA